MTEKYGQRVKETTTTTGTGTYDLAGAEPGYQSFVDGIGDTYTTTYCCTDGTDWEIGYGTITNDTTDTLSRSTILSSSNSGSEVDWAAGTRNIFCVAHPELFNYHAGSYTGNMYLAFGAGAVNANCPGVEVFASNKSLGTYLDGSAQVQKMVLAKQTTNATATGLGQTWGVESQFKQGTLKSAAADTASLLYDILVIARQVGGTAGTEGDSKAWRLQAMATLTTGTLAQVGSTTTTNIAASTGASAWTVTIDVSENLPIRITGEADKTIYWVGYITVVEASIPIIIP
jgi:hypothetical protein